MTNQSNSSISNMRKASKSKLNNSITNQLKQQINNERYFSFPKLMVLPTLSRIV